MGLVRAARRRGLGKELASSPCTAPPLPPGEQERDPPGEEGQNRPTSRGTVQTAWSGAKRLATRESLSLCQAEEEGGWAPWGHRASGSVTPTTGSSPGGSLTLKVCSAAGHNQCFER